MSDVDGLLERIRNWMNCGREWTDGLSEAWNIMSASLATIEQQRADLAAAFDELAEHKRRLGEQSAVLNDVRKSRDEYKRRLLGLEKNADE